MSGGFDPRWDDPRDRDDESRDVEVHWIELGRGPASDRRRDDDARERGDERDRGSERSTCTGMTHVTSSLRASTNAEYRYPRFEISWGTPRS